MRCRASLRVLLPAVVITWSMAAASATFHDDTVKAAFIYRFTGYVDWPASALQSREFVIGVLGSHGVAEELNRLVATRAVKNLPARVRVLQSPVQARETHLVYIGPGYWGDINDVIEQVATRPVLVVTDRSGALDEGSALNFTLVDRRVRFEVSLAAAERGNLKLSSQLLAVAVHVRGTPGPGREARP